MRINTNVSALNGQRILGQTGAAVSKSMAKLSSGFRINTASDDAAGLAIANKLRADSRALQQTSRNASQATAMLQVADSAAQTIGNVLNRMKELATQANSANIGTQRDKIQAEFTELKSEIDRITSTTKYQGTTLVDGTFGTKLNTAIASSDALSVTGSGDVAATGEIDAVTLTGAKAGTYTLTEVGAGKFSLTNTTSGDVEVYDTGLAAAAEAGGKELVFESFGITLKLDSAHTVAAAASNTDMGNIVIDGATAANFMVSSSGSANYGSTTGDLVSIAAVNLTTGASGLNLAAGGLTLSNVITTGADADRAALLGNIDSAIDKVNTALGSIGATMNRIDIAQQNTQSLLQNTQAAESVIRDADMAAEMTEFSKNQILQQAGISMLAQANSSSQAILKLLG